MKGLQRIVRRSALARLKGFGDLTSLVPAADIYSQDPGGVPSWPFVKLGPTQTLPFRHGNSTDGANVSMPIHAFARAKYNAAGGMTQTAEDHASAIGAQIESAIQWKGEVSDDVDVRLGYNLTDIRLMPDSAESDAFHWFATLNVRALSAFA